MTHTKERAGKTFLLAVMLCILLLSAFVYFNSAVFHLARRDIDAFEFIAYLVGYCMTELCLGAAVYEIAGKRKRLVSLWAAFACMVLRLAFDILTVLSDGYALSGLFQMDIFLVLDILILVCIIVVICNGSRMANILLVAVTAAYLFGEVAGYPIDTFDDIDEFVLMLGIFAAVTIPLIPLQKPNSDSPAP